MKKILRICLLSFLVINLTGPVLVLLSGDISMAGDWRTADRGSTGLAPLPRNTPEAVVQVYAARAFNWRGLFAVHTWIATKDKNANTYTVYQVLGWNERRGLPVVVSMPDIPDRSWYGYTPFVVSDIRGEKAETAIKKIIPAVEDYPYKNNYVLWPGPNSNTFTAYVGRHVPELGLDLPSNAIGKDYLPDGKLFAKTPSGSGFQFSILGLAGFLASRSEGLEINILGLVTGFNPYHPALKLAGIGKIEFN